MIAWERRSPYDAVLECTCNLGQPTTFWNLISNFHWPLFRCSDVQRSIGLYASLLNGKKDNCHCCHNMTGLALSTFGIPPRHYTSHRFIEHFWSMVLIRTLFSLHSKHIRIPNIDCFLFLSKCTQAYEHQSMCHVPSMWFPNIIVR